MRTLLLEGPFETDYSLAIVNRRLAKALTALSVPVRLHQRDNVTCSYPSAAFLRTNQDLADLFMARVPEWPADVHSRYIYPPFTDGFAGCIRVIHCYGWEESRFPQRYVEGFNADLDLITTMSTYVRDVLTRSGVQVPVIAVGLGADHILECEPVALDGFRSDAFTFLHVSSGFPRKAADVLVRAFCEEFTRREDVRLIIKTFENPHNEIERIVAEAGSRFSSHAPIEIAWNSWNSGELRWAYEHVGCLVSPSRGEGFGLPVAEAMFAGCPVVATAYSGQTDTCSERTCWPVAFRLEQARTHLTEGTSEWAEPEIMSLRQQLRAIYSASDSERRAKTSAAEHLVTERFTWRKVAERHWKACEEAFERKRESPRVAVPVRTEFQARAEEVRIGFVTSWNARCGIAEYTRYLASALPESFRPLVFASRGEVVRTDEDYVSRCWDQDGGADGKDVEPLLSAILASGVDAVSFQFNFGFFSPDRLRKLIEGLEAAGIPTAVTFHATKHANLARMKRTLGRVLCVCHRSEDVGRLNEIGLRDNVVLLPQGIPALTFDRASVRGSRRRATGSFVVACFGFFLPAKGIHLLIEAIALARRVNPLLELRLVNALYPIRESEEYARQCLSLIENRGLGDCVSVNTEFVDDQGILYELACSDVTVLPYPHSSESSSAAIRLPIASGTPILCSDIGIFDEFETCVHRFPSGNVLALANSILRFAANPDEVNRFIPWQQNIACDLSWPRIAEQFSTLLIPRTSQCQAVGTTRE